TRAVENTGRSFALSRRFAMAARPPAAQPMAGNQGIGPPAAPRFVKAQATVPGEGAPRLKTFKPKAKHRLAIWIDIARDTDASALVAGAPFDDSSLPAGDVELAVHVDCDALALHTSKPLSLSTVDRTVASTSAVFDFESGDEDQILTIRVLVTYRGRPMQELSIVGTVRAEPIGADQIRFTAIPLSAPPEPHEETTQGEAILVVNGANLERAGSDRKVDLSQVRPIIEKINKDASTVLAGSEVPESLDDPQALKLLVKLARAGSGLKDVLAPLALPEEGTLSLLIDMTTELLPLELVYDAEKPDKEAAVLCEHKPGGKRVGEPKMCPEAGAGVVCPMAFWGQRRSIVRTIRFPANHKSGRYESLRPIELRPLLYAAAAKADKGVKEKPLPTAFLAQQLQQLFGKDNVLFASNWTEWVDLIKRHPQLLLVLGHTESSDGDTVLEIGEKSWLTDVREAFLHVEGAPPPLVLLLACSTAVPRNPFGGLPAAFTAAGAAAVVGTLTKMQGPHGARAAAQVVKALWEASAAGDKTLGGALTAARRQLVQDGILDGLLLVSHGEIDMALRTT
ncbi:MAG: CHAT domain-containing protein, partial [Burkholderiaceae bacterium]